MRLPADAIIAREKMTRYLLRRQERGDKSAFLLPELTATR